MKRLLIIIGMLMVSGTAFAETEKYQCQVIDDADLRRGCHEKRAEPELSECHNIAATPLQLDCYDRLRPPLEKAERKLSPKHCATFNDEAAKLTCYEDSYAIHIDRKQPGYCLTLKDVAAKVKCFDEIQAELDKREPWNGNWTVVVREKDLPRTAALTEPATIGLARADGHDRGLLKAAITARGGTFSTLGWDQLISAEIHHDLTASTRTNTKSVSYALNGPWGDSSKAGALITTAQIKLKQDSEAHTQSRQITVDNIFVHDRLMKGEPFAAEGGYELLPIFGLMRDNIHKAKAGDPTGNATSVYGAAKLAFWVRQLPNVQFNLSAQRFVDLDVDSTREKRYESYYKIGADWYLYEPKDSTRKFTPIIGLAREYGMNPLEAKPSKKSITSFALRFKLDFS